MATLLCAKRWAALLPLVALILAVYNHASLRAADTPPPPPAVEPDDDDGDDDGGDGGEWFLGRRLRPGDIEIPSAAYTAARSHITGMPVFSIAGQSWTQLGPGNIGGRTRSWVIHPKDPKIMYVGSATGGVWKTIDGGQSWTPLFESQPVLTIGALAMDPSDPNTLYAGTGEYAKAWTGVGIFKTTDGGVTWNQLTPTAGIRYINRISVSNVNPQHVYAATNTGIWMSLNGGAAWTQTALNSSQALNGCRDMVMRTDTATDYLYASCYGKVSGGDASIWRNTDAAGTGTWSVVFTAAHMARTSLALAPSRQTTIYAMAASHGGDPNYESGLLAVYRSTSSGDIGTWVPRVTNADPNLENTVQLTETQGILTTAFCNGTGAPDLGAASGQGDYDNVLAVDPADPNRLWAGGIDIYRSDDGGANWGAAGRWQLGTIPAGQTLANYPHADNHIIVFHPAYDSITNATMFLGNDGGLFRTDNARDAVSTGPQGSCADTFAKNIGVKWVDLNGTYPTTQFYHGFAYPGGLAYMGGAQDNTVARGTDAGGIAGWTLPNGSGDGAAVAIDPADANSVFLSKQNLALRHAADGGTFLGATSGITEDSSKFPFIAYLAMDPNEGRRVFLGGTSSLWRSTDAGTSWTAAAPVEANSGVSAIAVSPFDSNTVLFGTNQGFLYRSSAALSTDNSKAWVSARPRSGVVSGVTFDPSNPNIIYASYSTLKILTTDAHLYKSSDGGVTWQPSDGVGTASLPDTPMFKLLPDPRNSSQLYLASDLGIFVSTDGGASWAHDPNAFSNVVVEDLAIDSGASSNWLFAFTFGRGVYRAPLPGAPNANCTYSVSPTSLTTDLFGGVLPVTISTQAGCSWAGIPGINPSAFAIQSPAQGTGTGQAFVVVPLNHGGAARSDVVTIANSKVTVTQSSATVFSFVSSDDSSTATRLNVGGAVQIDSRPLTSSASDPVHSCTGSADFKTAWWKVTPATSGFLQAQGSGRRYDVFGNYGMVLTAYDQLAPTVELSCTVVPKDTAAEIYGSIKFAVTAGSTYLIEASATGPGPQDGGFTTIGVSTASGPDVTISVTPATAKLSSGSSAQQFSAKVSNAANAAVRWSVSPPVGAISASGLYTAPSTISAPTTVIVTAVSYADPAKKSAATLTLTPGTGPVIVDVVNGATFQQGIVAGSWITLRGANFTNGVTQDWSKADFTGGVLPTTLAGVQVVVGGQLAAIYYVSPTQLNVQAPAAAKGNVSVQVITNGAASNTLTVTAIQHAPGLFAYLGGSRLYPAAVFLNSAIVGDPAVIPGTRAAKPGDRILLYATGIDPSPAGSIVESPITASEPVTVLIGSTSAIVEFAGLVAVGEFQINMIVPSLVDGNYSITVQAAGQSSPTNVVLPVRN